MDFTLYTVLKNLIMPPGGLILLLLLGFFLVRGVLGRIFLFVGISVFALMSLPIVAGKLMAGLEPYQALPPDALTETGAEGILILGAGRYTQALEYGGDTVSSASLERLRYGAFLHRRTGLPVYITGGSPPRVRPSVGQLMAWALEQEFGIAPAGVEDRSRTTDENAAFSVEMLAGDGIGHVLLVTDASHMPRALGAFGRVDIETIPAPTNFVHRKGGRGADYRDWLPSAEAFSISYAGIREYVGQVWYQLEATMGTAATSRLNPGAAHDRRSAP